METVLFLAHADGDGSLPRPALEALGVARRVARAAGASGFSCGVVGGQVDRAAESLAASGAARVFAVQGEDFAPSRYASDAAAAEAIARAAGATIAIAPGTSRWARALPGAAHRLGGRTDTHVVAVEAAEGRIAVSRWFYRQRLYGTLERSTRPWFIAIEPGAVPPVPESDLAGAMAPIERLSVAVPEAARRTRVVAIEAPAEDEQTIRPDAKLLFVAGAGWTKKQADGKAHVEEAERLILEFLRRTKASLGSTKSLVDLRGEGEAVLRFLTHLHQIGQTGSTPRHPKGLATCCHGEEPHVVGWRFVGERRAVNADPACGWTRGKADVVYVADAFQVLAALNRILAEGGCTASSG